MGHVHRLASVLLRPSSEVAHELGHEELEAAALASRVPAVHLRSQCRGQILLHNAISLPTRQAGRPPGQARRQVGTGTHARRIARCLRWVAYLLIGVEDGVGHPGVHESIADPGQAEDASSAAVDRAGVPQHCETSSHGRVASFGVVCKKLCALLEELLLRRKCRKWRDG